MILPAQIPPEILPTDKFKDCFLKCLSSKPVSVRVAVPFVDKIPGFGTVVSLTRFLQTQECASIQLITRPPGVNSGIISLDSADDLAKLGVDVVIRNRLHSKIYQFTFPHGDMAAFVGSANLTLGGFERNVETVVFLRQKEHNIDVAHELDRIAGRGAIQLVHWKSNKGIIPKEH